MCRYAMSDDVTYKGAAQRFTLTAGSSRRGQALSGGVAIATAKASASDILAAITLLIPLFRYYRCVV